MTKKVVQYRAVPGTEIKIGAGAFIIPVDHPDTALVTNGDYANTSRVLSYNSDTGEFETLNTSYVPA